MLFPKNKAELREIILSARREGRGLVAQSSSGPHIHGASENTAAETVNFGEMNSVLKVSRHDRYIRLESGVGFAAAIDAAAAEGLRLNVPFLPRAGKSAVASALEREAVIIPKYQFDYTDPLLTLEAVFGTGDEFRTGSAAGPGPAEELRSDMVTPWGPGTVDYLRFFSGAQGTMGFVTWATLKAEVKPTMVETWYAESAGVGTLCALADRLLRYRVADECVILSAAYLAEAFCDSGEEADALSPTLSPWTLIFRIAGYERYPEQRLGIYRGYALGHCDALGIEPSRDLGGRGEIAGKIDAMLGDCDRRETYWKTRRGGVEELTFLAPLSKTAALASLAEEKLCALNKSAVAIFPQVQGRAFRIECDAFHSGSGDEEKCAMEQLSARLMAAGAYFDRPYGHLADAVYGVDADSTEALRRVKKIFDPDGILNPGKLCF